MLETLHAHQYTPDDLAVWVSGYAGMGLAERQFRLSCCGVRRTSFVRIHVRCAVCVCICICVCNRVLPFTTHVCDVLLCVRDRALHRIAHAHGVFGRHAHGYTHTHAHMVDTDIINARTISPNSFSFRGIIGIHRLAEHIPH